MGEPFDPALEDQILSEAANYRASVDVARTEVTEESADALAQMLEDYPWMPVDMADALVTAGITAVDPSAKIAAGAAFADGQELGTIGGTPGPVKSYFKEAEEPGVLNRLTDRFSQAYEDTSKVLPILSMFSDTVDAGPAIREEIKSNPITEGLGEAAQAGREHLGVGDGSFVDEQVLKPTVRGAMVVLDSPVQMTQGTASVLHDAYVEDGWRGVLTAGSTTQVGLQALEQTDIGQVTNEIMQGNAPDLGNGFFVDEESEVGQARLSARMRYETVNGQPFTVGNLVADQVATPGSTEYTMLAGLTDLSLEVAGPGAAFDHLFLANRVRNTISPENAQTFLTSNRGTRVMEGLAESTSFSFIDRALGEAADPAIVEAIRVTDDVDEVSTLVRSQLGLEVTDAPSLPRFQPIRDTTRNTLPSVSRWFGQVPDNTISITDPRQRVTTTRRYLQTANADAGEIDYFLSRMASASNPGQIREVTQEMLEVTSLRAYQDALGVRSGRVANADAATRQAMLADAPEEIRAISRAWGRIVEENRAFWVEALENGDHGMRHMDFWGEDIPSPQAFSELLSNSIPLPTYREVRSVFASPGFEALMKIPGGAKAHHIADLGMERLMGFWKGGRLLRIAWPLKVLSEGQLRLAMFGYSGITNSPIDYLAHAIGRVGRGDTDALGGFLSASDEMQAAMFDTADLTRIGPASQVVYADGFVAYNKGQTLPSEYLTHYADAFNRFASSPETAMFLRSETFEEASEFFWENMRGVRERLQQGRPSDTADIVNSRLDADNYLRTNIQARIESMTGGNPELLEAMRTMSLDGHSVVKSGNTTINRRFVEALGSRWDSIPEVINGRNTVTVGRERSSGLISSLFSGLMSTPSNKLDRSPLFRQQYWRSVERMAVQIDPKHADTLVENAREAGLSRRQIQTINDRARRRPPDEGRILNIGEADEIAKSDGLKAVRDVLYDASERNQFFDIWRHVFPFGDAFVEVMSRWARIFAENPNRINKAEAFISSTSGIFTENQWGEETFNIPFSQQALSAFGVENMSLRGFASGLSIATEMWPGYGPVVQVPASAVIPDDPDYLWLENHLSSGFGLPPDFLEDPSGVLADTAVPPWIRRAISAASGTGLTEQEQRVVANLVGDIALHKIANDPNWNISLDDESLAALLDESRREAQVAYAIRSIATFTFPGAPTFELTTDVTGETLASWVVEVEYRRMVEELGPQAAADQFAATYGFDALALTAPASRDFTNGGGMPLHREGVNWAQRNEFAADAYPEVFGFFAPPADPEATDDFVYEVYAQRFTDGDSQALNPEQRIGLLQDYIARSAYAAARDQVLEAHDGSIPQPGQEYLRQVRASLEETYPGYRGVPGVGETVSVEDQILQLAEAASDPRLADAAVTSPLAAYLERRDLVNDNSEGAGFQTGNADAYNRQHLYDVGTALAAESPEFAEVWERVLYREFRSRHEQDLEGS